MMRIAMMTKIGVTMITKVSRCRHNDDYNENKDKYNIMAISVMSNKKIIPSHPSHSNRRLNILLLLLNMLPFSKLLQKAAHQNIMKYDPPELCTFLVEGYH